MLYFSVKSDLKFLKIFKDLAESLWSFEDKVKENFKPSITLMGKNYSEAVSRKAAENPDCMKVREKISKSLPRADEIAIKNNVSINVQSLAPASIGGPALPVNLFFSILKDTSWDHVDQLWIKDKINETIGQCERRIKKELYQLINPFYWLKEIIKTIIRLPFILLNTSGFNVSKIEDHLIGRIIKLVEIILLIYILIKLGFEKEYIANFIKAIIIKN